MALALTVVPALSGCTFIPREDRQGAIALEQGHTLVGAWLGSWPGDDNPVLRDFKRETGVKPDLVDIYLDWSTPVENLTHAVEHVAAQGAVPILTWEAHGITTPDVVAGTKRLSLRDGTHPTIDEYLADFATGLCGLAESTKQPVLLRVFHEMNGNWFSWGTTWTDAAGRRPNSDANYRAAWVTVHDAFSAECGSDVKFVWAINHFSVGSGATFTGTYPGDRYVDFVGIDGYNWGTKASWGWQTPDAIFATAYCAVVAVTSKPIFLAEVASSEQGGDKAAWIEQLYAAIDHYNRVQGFVWLNDKKYESQTDGTLDWPVDSSRDALKAYSQGANRIIDARDGPAPSRAATGCPAPEDA